MEATASGPAPQHRVDVYDERNLQAKALERWNKQREAWDGMKTRLLSHTGHGIPSRGMADNFTFSSARHRERQEELGMIEAAVPLSALSSHYTWESMLRRHSDADGMRYVQLGKAYFPYALFGEVKDPTARKLDHAVYTRVVAEDYLMDPLSTIDTRTGKRESWAGRKSRLFASTSTGMRGSTAAASKTDPRDADLDAMEAALRAMGGGVPVSDDEESEDGDEGSGAAHRRVTLDAPTHLAVINAYYKQQLRAYAPYIEKRFAHFAVPRQFLAVEGHAAPITYATEADLQAEGLNTTGDRGDDVDPVQYYPPPLPPSQQRVAIPSATGSRPHTAEAASASHGTPSTGRAGRGTRTPTPFLGTGAGADRAAPASKSVSIRLSSVGEVLAAAGLPQQQASRDQDDGMNDSKVFDHDTGADAGAAEATKDSDSSSTEARPHPALELSTQRLFLHASPGELAHAHLSIRNTSTITVYYSWVAVDLVQEDLNDAKAAALEATEEERGEEDLEASVDEAAENPKDKPDAGAAFIHAQQTLHHMAAHTAASRHFFRLSSPTNGVLLPEEDALFPFSVRAPGPGHFKQRYELLTIPPSPIRIFVEVTALVKPLGRSARALARPVEAALNARAAQTSQRHLVQQLVRQDVPLDAADLLSAIDAVRQQKQDVVDKEEARRRAQREAWRRYNAITYDGVPYSRAVYDKLEKLWENLHEALYTLTGDETYGTPETPSTGVAADPLTVIATRVWNGSLNALLAKVALLRDAPSRNTLYDAIMALLRAARCISGASSATSPVASAFTDITFIGEGEALTEEALQAERTPLSTLLHRAADALARQIESRRLAAYQQEVDMLQLPMEPSPYACASGGAAGGPSTASGGTASDRKKRAPSASGARKGGASAHGNGGGGGGASTAAAASSGVFGAGGGAAAGQGAAGGLVLLGSLRGHLKDAASYTIEEEDWRRAEKAEMLRLFQRRLEDEHEALRQSLWRELGEAVEAGCDLSLVNVVQAHRLEELRAIQTHAPMTVDATVEVMPMKTSTGASSGRKRTN